MNEISPIGFGGFTESATSATTSSAQRPSSFANIVAAGIGAAEQSSAAATDVLARYAVGEPVSAHELMISMEKARMTLQLTVEIRNRLLEAYQEVSRMQI